MDIARVSCLIGWVVLRTSILLAICCVPAAAQTAQLSGVVKDDSGAVIAQATVTIISESTNAQRVVQASDRGFYAVPLLSPGAYRVLVASAGFQTLSRSGVILEVGQHARLDVTLAVGIQEAVVTVEGSRSLVNAQDATVATTIEPHLVQNAPLSGRTLQSLLTLAPGVVLVPANSIQGQFTVNGQRASSNYVAIDGVSANLGTDTRGRGIGPTGSGGSLGFAATGGTNNLVSVDALQEFNIQTSTYAPEFGRMPGGQVTMVTRSGSNQFHGSGFEYFRDDAMDATDWFVNSIGAAKPSLRMHNFGGTLGGPVLPNRTFFFGSYEGQRLTLPRALTIQVPSLPVRSSATLPAVRSLFQAYPEPNGRDLGNGWAEFTGSWSNKFDLDSFSGRVDQRFNRDTLFVRVSRAHSDGVIRDGGSSLSSLLGTEVKTTTVTVGHTRVLRSSSIIDTRVNYSENTSVDSRMTDSFGGAGAIPIDVLLPSSIAPTDAYAAFFIATGIPGSWFASGPLGGSRQRQFNAVGTMTQTVRAHQIKMGVDYRRLFPDARPPAYNVTFIGTGPLPLAQGTLPRLTFSQTLAGRPVFENFSLYAQDTWRATERLSVMFGGRWEYNPPPHSGSGMEPVLVTGLETASNPQILPEGSELWDANVFNLAPRVGAAYTLRTQPGFEGVVRAGWGVFYDTGHGSSGAAFGGGFPFETTLVVPNALLPPSDTQIALSEPDRNQPMASKVFAFSPDLKLPRTYQWNVAYEQALAGAQAVSITYVGARGRDLLRRETLDLSRSNQTVQNVELLTNAGYSSYDALQFQFQRRLADGWSALISYTLGEAKDTESTGARTVAPSSRLNIDEDYGYSDYDVRHLLRGAASVDSGRLVRPWLERSAVLDGLFFDVMFTFQSATPLTPTYSRDLGFGSFQFRPDAVSGVPVYIDDPASPGGRRINRDAFVIPSEARQGTLPRNTVRGFDLLQVDCAISKRVPLGSRVAVLLRAEAFNVLNRSNFGPPFNGLTSTLFGRPRMNFASSLGEGGSASGLNPLFQVGGPRSLQISARVTF